MKFNPNIRFSPKVLFTIVGGAVLINPAFAQDQQASGEELEEVVVTGLRGSLKASMDTKREAVGRRVGYRTRLETRVSDATRIEVVTEGILTRTLGLDPTLEGGAHVHKRAL